MLFLPFWTLFYSELACPWTLFSTVLASGHSLVMNLCLGGGGASLPWTLLSGVSVPWTLLSGVPVPGHCFGHQEKAGSGLFGLS